MNNKLTFDFPDYIPMSRWTEWMDVKWENDINSKIISIEIVSGKPKDEIKKTANIVPIKVIRGERQYGQGIVKTFFCY